MKYSNEIPRHQMKYPNEIPQVLNEISLHLPTCYDKIMATWHNENEKLPALYEIFHKRVWHYTRRPAGSCHIFIIKVVATSAPFSEDDGFYDIHGDEGGNLNGEC